LRELELTQVTYAIKRISTHGFQGNGSCEYFFQRPQVEQWVQVVVKGQQPAEKCKKGCRQSTSACPACVAMLLGKREPYPVFLPTRKQLLIKIMYG
jgi:hypothetical protein